MKLFTIFGLALIIVFTSIAFAGDIKVINAKSGFPEGPLWHKDKLFYVEYGSQTVMTWDGKQNQEFWRMDGCGPSAIVALPAGDFLVTCYDSGSIARISAEGKTIAEYKQDKEGRGFQGPNDFVVDKKGGVYFTASGPWESEPIVGMVFYMNPKGEIMQVADDLHYANGIALSKDGKTLFLAESEASRVIQFKVQQDGSLSGRRLFVRIGQVDPESGCYAYPDGLKMDSKENLYIGLLSKGRIVVVSPNKKLVKTIDVPSSTAPNLTFGPDEAIVYIMAVEDLNNAPYWGKVYEVPNK
jgi:sugar lactone lactonase YvrE